MKFNLKSLFVGVTLISAVSFSTSAIAAEKLEANLKISNPVQQIIFAKYEPEPNGNPKSDGTGTRAKGDSPFTPPQPGKPPTEGAPRG